MAGLRSLTNKVLVAKKVNGFYETKDGKDPVPKRQLILIDGDSSYQPTCSEDVLKKVEEYKEYRFWLETDFASKRSKIVDVLFEDKK